MQSSNGEHAPQQDKRLLPKGDQRRYTAETVRRTRPKTYRKAVQLLADPTWSVLQISKTLRLSEHTVRAIRQREAQSIAERKKTLAAMLADVAELGAERMEVTIGKASLRDAAIGTGIAVDKMLARAGQTPPTVGVVVMPSETDREERRAIDAKLNAIARRLADAQTSTE